MPINGIDNYISPEGNYKYEYTAEQLLESLFKVYIKVNLQRKQKGLTRKEYNDNRDPSIDPSSSFLIEVMGNWGNVLSLIPVEGIKKKVKSKATIDEFISIVQSISNELGGIPIHNIRVKDFEKYKENNNCYHWETYSKCISDNKMKWKDLLISVENIINEREYHE